MSSRVLRDRATLKPATAAERAPAIASLTPQAEAKGISDALNRAIRLYEPYQDNDGKFVKSIYNKNIGDIRLLVNETASSCWSPGFNNMLRRCVYVRSQPELVDKEVYRTEGFKCVACGRWEHCNPRTVDVFGFLKEYEDGNKDLMTFDADEAATKFEDIAYWMDDLQDTEVERGHLACFDLGRLTMGETCHARFELVMGLRGLMFDKYMLIRDEIDQRMADGTIEAIESKLYGDSDEEAMEYIERRAALECALVEMEAPFPPSKPTKAIFDLVDLARADASGGDDDALKALLRQRTHLELSGMPKRRRVNEDEEEEEADGDEDAEGAGEECLRAEVVGDEEEEKPEASSGGGGGGDARHRDSPPLLPRRRSRVIEDDDDEEEEDPEAGSGGSSGGDARRSWVIDDDDDEEEEDPEAGSGGGGGGIPNAAAQAQDRRAPQAIGRLPSRHKAIVNALRLAAELQAQGHTSESATVTNLVATCQELLDDRRAPQAIGRLPSRHKVIVNALRLAAELQAQGHTSESATITNLVATCQELLDDRQA